MDEDTAAALDETAEDDDGMDAPLDDDNAVLVADEPTEEDDAAPPLDVPALPELDADEETEALDDTALVEPPEPPDAATCAHRPPVHRSVTGQSPALLHVRTQRPSSSTVSPAHRVQDA